LAEGKRRLWLILGVAGTGKSHYAHRIVAETSRLVLYDTTGHEGFCGRYVRIEDRDSLREYLRLNCWKRFRIAYKANVNDPDELSWLCDLCYAMGYVSLVIDELDLHCTPQSLPAGLKRLAVQGRHRNVDFVGVAREPQAVPVSLRSQATDIVSFYYFDPRAMEWFKAAGCPEFERIRDLKGHDFLHWRGGELVSEG